jgi:hypothetical protein
VSRRSPLALTGPASSCPAWCRSRPKGAPGSNRHLQAAVPGVLPTSVPLSASPRSFPGAVRTPLYTSAPSAVPDPAGGTLSLPTHTPRRAGQKRGLLESRRVCETDGSPLP